MSRLSSPRISPRRLAAYVDGEVTPSDAVAIEKVLSESPELRRRAQDLRHIRNVLSSHPPAVGAVDLKARVRLALEREQLMQDDAVTPARKRLTLRTWSIGLAAAVACAAALVLVAQPQQARRPTQVHPAQMEFRTKSAGEPPTTDAASGGRWAGITAFRVAGDQEPARLGARLPAGDGLLFSYTNGGRSPFAYLMIFGVDARGDVHWFFPAPQTGGADPSSMIIEKGRVNVNLAELLHDQFAPGRLVVHAIFSRQPLRVSEVAAWVREDPGGVPRGLDAYQQVLVTTVE